MAVIALLAADLLLVVWAVEEVMITIDFIFFGGPCVC
jgi:hypothetical protein